MKLINQALVLVKRNSPVILSSVAIAGVVSTAYLTGKASIEASRIIEQEEGKAGTHEHWRGRLKERVPLVWKRYIPASVSGAMTITCIVGSTKIGNRRAIAAQTALILTERAYSEYREKVVEEIGKKAEEKIRGKIAEDRVRQVPPPSQEAMVIVSGNVLCCELYTGRYFQSDMETLRKAQNDLNAMLIRQDMASMEEWYHLIGLQPTSYSSDVGWNSDKQMELLFSTVLTEDGRPCLAFEYNYYRSLYDGFRP